VKTANFSEATFSKIQLDLHFHLTEGKNLEKSTRLCQAGSHFHFPSMQMSPLAFQINVPTGEGGGGGGGVES